MKQGVYSVRWATCLHITRTLSAASHLPQSQLIGIYLSADSLQISKHWTADPDMRIMISIEDFSEVGNISETRTVWIQAGPKFVASKLPPARVVVSTGGWKRNAPTGGLVKGIAWIYRINWMVKTLVSEASAHLQRIRHQMECIPHHLLLYLQAGLWERPLQYSIGRTTRRLMLSTS